MSFEVEPVNRSSLSSQIADQLQEAILDGTLKADDRLPTEDELSKRYQVSRPTIREALKRLAAKNLVRSKRGPTGGTFVTKPSVAQLSDSLTSAATMLVSLKEVDLDEINAARLELESTCCRLAATYRSENQLSALTHELKVQEDERITAEDFCASDVRFHRIIADASGNRMLAFVMYAVIEALQPVANMIAYRFRERTVIIDHHRRILEAIQQQDADLACAILKEQIEYLAARHQDAQDWRAGKGD
ncbi:FadR/GntR family transcriptional regulator [Pontibacterium sp.]|uniref:FadR/GntR family transcriptional regulator n=1 Tax=Pontibacterium sp. TaxID=2036026 RepID=UPI0035646438